MRRADTISDAELAAADGIHTVDPNDANAAGHQLWGHRSAASQEGRSEPDKLILEIALPSDDHVALLALIARIEKAKGSLPPDVAVLRKNLAT